MWEKTSFSVAYSIPERGGKNIKLLNIHAMWPFLYKLNTCYA